MRGPRIVIDIEGHRLRSLVDALRRRLALAAAALVRHVVTYDDELEACLGVALLAIGAAKIYAPLGYIVPGAALLTFAIYSAISERRD